MLKKYGYYDYAGDCATIVEHEAFSAAIKGHQAKAKCFPLIRRMLSFLPEYLILIPKKLSNIHKWAVWVESRHSRHGINWHR